DARHPIGHRLSWSPKRIRRYRLHYIGPLTWRALLRASRRRWELPPRGRLRCEWRPVALRGHGIVAIGTRSAAVREDSHFAAVEADDGRPLLSVVSSSARRLRGDQRSVPPASVATSLPRH